VTTKLSLVIPAYNEAERLSAGLSQLVDRLTSDDTEILVIDDGSTDGTAAVARRQLASWPQHSVVSLVRNSGKGAAVRAGVVRARGDVIAFVDADMATDPRDLGPLVSALEGNHVAVGSRAHDSSVVDDRSPYRTMMTRTFGLVVASLMQLPMGDTQCGFKAFKGSIAKLLFHGSRVDRFAFDVEVLNLAARLGLRTQEVPVRWSEGAGSHIRPLRDAVQMLADVARIRWTWRIQPPMQGLFLPEVPFESAAPLIRPLTRSVDLTIRWKGGTAVLFPCVPPTVAHRITKRLLPCLQTYDPRVLSVEFDALFAPITSNGGHSGEWTR
jgi:dolichyl-phosphate beta-glucosyltransferase